MKILQNKKLLAIVCACLIAAVLLCVVFATHSSSNAKKKSEPYIFPEPIYMEKDLLSAQNGIEFDQNVCLLSCMGFCDLCVRGDIIFIGEREEINCTQYTVAVNECYLGKLKTDTVQMLIPGKLYEEVTKPTAKTEVMLFLDESSDYPGWYVPRFLEHGIITLDEDLNIYTYSNVYDIAQYDGKTLPILLRRMKEYAVKYDIPNHIF